MEAVTQVTKGGFYADILIEGMYALKKKRKGGETNGNWRNRFLWELF